MAEKTATFTIDLKSNAGAVAPAAASEVEQLRQRIEQAQSSVKGMQGALKSLRGASDEVAAAKEGLKSKIEAEKGAISQANLALLKHGTTFHKVADEAKKTKAAEDKLREGIKAAGGPVAELTEKFDKLKGVMSGANGGAGALALGVGALVIGVVGLTAATLAAGIKLGKFVIEGANALRSMNLMREAATGSAKNAEALGTQVDFLSRKVSTSKEKINELGVSLVKSLSGGTSRASGQAIVDTFAAVTEASAAMDDEVGNTLKGIIERSKTFGRISINPFELQGTGLKFGDIAASLAKNLHVSIDQAKQALFNGRVGLDAGAKAIRDAVEARFGAINAKKLLDVDVQFEKFHEDLIGLTKGVALEPLLKGLDTLLSKFDVTTVTGQSIQRIFTKIGDAIVKFSVGHIDDVVKGVEGLVLFGLQAVDLFDRWGTKVKGVTDVLTGNALIMGTLKGVAVGLLIGIGALALGVGALATALAGVAAAVGLPFYLLYKGYQLVKNIKWGELGTDIIDGLVGGITRGAGRAVDAVKNLAKRIKDAFTGKDGIDAHSPSRFFEKGGKDSTAGYAQGVERSAPRAREAVLSLVPNAPRASSGAGGRAAASEGGGIVVNLVLNLPAGMAHETARELAKKIGGPDILRELTRAVREGLITQGVPTQTQVA